MSDKKFATLSSLGGSGGGGGGHDSGDESGSGDEGQAYYAGGEKSGQQVLGPPKKKDAAGVASELDKAAQGQDEGGPSAPDGARLRLTLWQDGFSVEDGPLRDYQSPDGQEFMKALMTGRVPAELIRSHGQHVDLAVDKRIGEAYKAGPMKPFGGEGNRLGAFAPTVASAAASSSALEAAQPAPVAEPEMELKAGEPTTTLQIRLADGGRLKATFNESHTLSDVRAFIARARPNYSAVEFGLQGGFPPKVMADESATLKAAGLLNAVVIMKVRKDA